VYWKNEESTRTMKKEETLPESGSNHDFMKTLYEFFGAHIFQELKLL